MRCAATQMKSCNDRPEARRPTRAGADASLRRVPIEFITADLEVCPIRHVPVSPRGLADFGIHFSSVIHQNTPVRILGFILVGIGLLCGSVDAQTNSPPAELTSRVLEVAGHVEYVSDGGTNWQTASPGLTLQPGARVRTREQSRAAVQLSDRSVIRLNERTTLQILPPRRAEKKHFGLPAGSIYFFNREKPADVEFDTPLAAGAIRGTEFLLEVAEAGGATHLALMDGLVELSTHDEEISIRRGEELHLAPGQLAKKNALLNANTVIQWALYYPAVLNPDELDLNTNEQSVLGDCVKNYRAGDLLGALNAWPTNQSFTNTGARILRAQLLLAVGRVTDAEQLLAQMPDSVPSVAALRELISVVRADAGYSPQTNREKSGSEWLAHSYALQARADLPAARDAARNAVKFAPQSGFAHARLAELEFSFGNRRAALEELKQAYTLSPRLAPAYSLQGFTLLDQGLPGMALVHFDHARELDAALGSAWLGRGLCLLRQGKFAEARESFQAAAALEPQRGLFRSYLGKAASELGDAKAAEKEFRLAKTLDANDPTAWLYSALHLWQENRLNAAIRDLEASIARNDNRAAFRSRLLLDGDRSVRSANLAAIYDDAGLTDVSRHTAARSVTEDYGNFSGHLFLSDSLRSDENANRFDLRLETARQSELLVANLLAPPGAGNLSQNLSQRDHIRFFDEKPVGVSSLTEYSSRGDWRENGTVFGSVGGFSYAFDAAYASLNGWQPNGQSETRELTLTAKQRVTPDDEAYFQIGQFESAAGDVANHYDPSQAKTNFVVNEKQEPTLYAGWHHAWSPGSHTLLLLGRLTDRLSFQDADANFFWLRNFGGPIAEVVTRTSPQNDIPFAEDFRSEFTLYSTELQQIWETDRQSLVLGGRWQSGDVDARADLSRGFPLTSDHLDASLERGNAYAYYSLQVLAPLRLIGGVSYDHLRFPMNADLAPLTAGEDSRDLVSPKAGLLFTPWERGLLRASYTKSLGGLYFDNSVRLEPTQIAGFNQAFRSLIPESVAGLVPGTEFETAGVGFDQSLASGTFFGIEAEWLTSDGRRAVGAVTNSQPAAFFPPDSPASTREDLNFRERNLSAYIAQLLGDNFSVSARYRISEARLQTLFPEIPDTATGLAALEAGQRATLQQLSFAINFHHRCGAFARWESSWHHQNNADPAMIDDDFWQHDLLVGYRFPRRHAEVRLGVLNLFNQDYRLSPLNLHQELPRDRTFVASMRFNF
ncbi:MAG: tetratricopeptide repeat protein [Verrucomicrobia bacterium]|nr:MAG: tetratricopeptide repeat protein [Verrucomicrobiota bacterium]